MSAKTTRLVALFVLLLLTLPAFAQGSKPNPTPAATKGSTTLGPTSQGGTIRQWAFVALGSSQYGEDAWSAAQATGEPDSSGCLDQSTAFATLAPNDGEYLIVGFETPVIPTQINVHLVFNPGTIRSISVADSQADNSIIELTNSGNVGSGTCPGIHSINVTGVTQLVDSVIINLDQAFTGTWTEIDAVELIGLPAGSTPPSANTPTGPTGRATPIPQLPDTIAGIEVNCPNGISFTNGVEVIVNMRPGFNYTATSIGMGAFDPIIAIVDENNNTLCNDDEPAASDYIASLPTTGAVGPSNFTAHKTFSYSGATLGNVSVIVGSVGSTAGEFLLLIEGLVVTNADGSGEAAGDPFMVNVTPNMIASGVPYTAYMISVTSALDAMITTVDLTGDAIIRLDDGTPISCDDAGSTTLCFGLSENLTGYYVSRENGRELGGGDFDAMLSIPADVFTIQDGGFLNFRFTSSSQSTLGDYVAAFHLGTVASGR